MKKILLFLFLVLLSVASAYSQTVNELITQSRTQLELKKPVNANAKAEAALKLAPNNPDANVLVAITRLLTFVDTPACSALMTRLGFGPNGRNIYNWTNAPGKHLNGDLFVPANFSAAELAAFIKTNLVPALRASEANLAKITDKNFVFTFTPAETTSDFLTFDYGDFQLCRAGLNAFQFACRTIASWNLDVQLEAIRAYGEHPKATLDQILAENSKLLTFANVSDLLSAKTDFLAAINLYSEASTFIRARKTRVTRVFNLDSVDLVEESEFRSTLLQVKSSLTAPVVLSTATNVTLDLSKFFSPTVAPRDLLPSVHSVTPALPDPTFGGVVTFGKGITSVTIPKGTTSLGSSAYFGYTSLTTVTIPSSVSDIANDAFQNCTALTSFTVDALNPFYSSEGGVIFNKSKTKLIRYPAAKSGSYTIPNSVTSIRNRAFLECKKLTSVSIPASVTAFEDAFQECTKLTSFTVDPLNPSYSSESGVIFNKSKTSLIVYPPGKAGDYTIPNGVTSIGNNSWDEFPAFYYCKYLTSVTIPASVTFIKSEAFAGCVGLKSVYFLGNRPQPQPDWYSESDELYGDYNATVYYIQGKRGWETPYGDRPTVVTPPRDPLTYTTSANSITITGSNPQASGALVIPAKINNLPVTSIGTLAFSGSTGLTSVSIPSSVTSISTNAFSGCTSLTNFTVDPLNASFSSGGGTLFNKAKTSLLRCPLGQIGSYTISNTVTSIGALAFNGCIGLTTIIIPKSLTLITSDTFAGCSGLTSLTVDSLNTTFSSPGGVLYNKAQTSLLVFPSGKMGDYTLSNSVTSISASAFVGCAGLTSLTIPSSVTSIGASAFSGCSGLTSVYFLGNQPTVGTNAFAGNATATVYYIPGKTGWGTSFAGRPAVVTPTNTPLTFTTTGTSITITGSNPKASGALVIPAKINNLPVTSIAAYAFYESSGLKTVTIPKSVTSISETAFGDCTANTGFTVDALNTAYTSVNEVLFNKAQTKLVAFPAGKTGSYTIPAGVASIDAGAFANCLGLTNVTVPTTVTSIGELAFLGCAGLTTVTIHGSLPTIKIGAFAGCTALTSIYFSGNQPTVESNVFLGDRNATVYYVQGKTGWGTSLAGRPTALWKPSAPVSRPDTVVRTIPMLQETPSAIQNPFETVAPLTPPTTVMKNLIVLQTATNSPNSVWIPVVSNSVGGEQSQQFYRFRAPILEAAPDLANPVWTPVATNNVTTNQLQRFYRLLLQ